MELVKKGQVDEDPKIPEDYYLAELNDINTYDRDDEAVGIVMRFSVENEDSQVELPFFAPAKLSISREAESSRLARNLENLELLKPVLQELDAEDEVMSEKVKAVFSGEDVSELVTVLDAVFAGKIVRVNVEDSEDGESSQISKFSRLWEEDSEDSEDVVFDEDEE